MTSFIVQQEWEQVCPPCMLHISNCLGTPLALLDVT